MFLVCTGALQSIPTDYVEAATVDGATGRKAFRKITFPLLLVAVSPLLIASFAFNFNNFTSDLAAHRGRSTRCRARRPGQPTSCCPGPTASPSSDIDPKRQGLAAALSVVDLHDRRRASRRSDSSTRKPTRRSGDHRRPHPTRASTPSASIPPPEWPSLFDHHDKQIRQRRRSFGRWFQRDRLASRRRRRRPRLRPLPGALVRRVAGFLPEASLSHQTLSPDDARRLPRV